MDGCRFYHPVVCRFRDSTWNEDGRNFHDPTPRRWPQVERSGKRVGGSGFDWWVWWKIEKRLWICLVGLVGLSCQHFGFDATRIQGIWKNARCFFQLEVWLKTHLQRTFLDGGRLTKNRTKHPNLSGSSWVMWQTTSWCGFHIPLLGPEDPKGFKAFMVETNIFTHLDLQISRTKLSHQQKN